MRIHYLQHVPFEGLGCIYEHLLQRGHQLSATHLYRNQQLPDLDHFDALIVLGGPMGVDAETDYPWLQLEKALLAAAIAAGKKVLGICLGAQLIAAALGAKVYRNQWREIGWWPVTQTPAAITAGLKLLPQNYVAFHWHGDTFDLPTGAIHLAQNAACQHQAFNIADQIIGLQFHLETTPDSARDLIKHGRDELDGSRYVQTAEQMLAEAGCFATSNRLMTGLLDQWLGDKTAASNNIDPGQ